MKPKKHIGKAALVSSPKPSEVGIKEATASYERWMRRCTTVISSDLRSKHEQMKDSPFLFLRELSTGGLNNGRQSVPSCATHHRFSLSGICI